MPSTSSAKKRSAIASVSRPGLSHVYAQLAADRKTQRRRGHVQVGPQLDSSTPSWNSAADPLLVTSPRGDELVAPLALEVAPLLRPHRATSSCSATIPRCARSASRSLSTAGSVSGIGRARRGRRPRRPAASRRAGPASSRCARRPSPSGHPSPRPGRRSTCRDSPSRRRVAGPGASARSAGRHARLRTLTTVWWEASNVA